MQNTCIQEISIVEDYFWYLSLSPTLYTHTHTLAKIVVDSGVWTLDLNGSQIRTEGPTFSTRSLRHPIQRERTFLSVLASKG